MKHANDVITPKNHTHATVVFITNDKNLYDKSIHIQMMLDTGFY